jgi:hypothetical protein
MAYALLGDSARAEIGLILIMDMLYPEGSTSSIVIDIISLCEIG